MKSLLRSRRPTAYSSAVECSSAAFSGVSFTIRRISLGRRIELARAVRDLALELDFRQAGEAAEDQVEGAALSARIDEIYLRWGLVAIRGLVIDGGPPTAGALYAVGPESLLREIVDRIKSECGLSAAERKN